MAEITKERLMELTNKMIGYLDEVKSNEDAREFWTHTIGMTDKELEFFGIDIIK